MNASILQDREFDGVPTLPKSSVSLPVFVRLLARHVVWRRTVWADLLRAAMPGNGYVTIPSTAPRQTRGPLLSRAAASQSAVIPSRASELADSYEADVRNVLLTSEAAMQKVIWQIATEFQDGIVRNIGASSSSQKLRNLLGSETVIEQLTFAEGTVAGQLQEPWNDALALESFRGFPFRFRRDEEQKVITDTHFGWAHERCPNGNDVYQHQLYVIRLRQELTEGIVHAVVSRLSVLLTAIHREWTQVLKHAEQELLNCQQLTNRQIADKIDSSLPEDAMHSLKLAALRSTVQ